MMSQIMPFHAANADVHHNNDRCTIGKKIEKSNKKEGEGGRQLCEECERLNQE